MTAKKIESSENLRKRKRIVPTRAAGTPAFENPADELFAAAFANRNTSGKPIVEVTSPSDLDSQITDKEIAEKRNLDSQDNNIGNPTTNSLDISIAKEVNWIAKDAPALDSQLSKEKTLDSQKTVQTSKWNKYDKKRSTASVFIRADSELVKEIKHFNIENSFEMKEFFELASRSFLDSFGNPTKNDLAINIALDDRRKMMLYKTKNSIINLFREYNKIFNPKTDWKPKDDAVGVKYNDVDLRIIEIGIIQTQGNILESDVDTKPERFKYYTREVDKFAALGYSEDMLDIILMTNRKRWKELTGREIDLSFL